MAIAAAVGSSPCEGTESEAIPMALTAKRMSPDVDAGGGNPVADRTRDAASPGRDQPVGREKANPDQGDLDAAARTGEPYDRTGDRDDRHRGPVTSGDAANVGTRLGGTGVVGAGGATKRGTVGDAGADAGDGSIDASDATDVTGYDTDAAPIDDGSSPRAVGSPRGAPGALDPDDLDTSDVSFGPSSVGPAADERGPNAGATGTGTGTQPYPGDVGGTNVRGPRDEERERESPAGR
jgi:hypothetical protein